MNGAGRSLSRLQRLVSVTLLALVATSWPLWLARDEFPSIPWFRCLTVIPNVVDALLLAGALMLTVATLICPDRPRLTALQGSLWAMLVALDQHRLQPWMYEFLLLLGILTMTRTPVAIRCSRAIVISIYFWSGLSKIDPGFIIDHGQMLLDGLLRALGLSAAFWTESQRHCAAALMPAGELLIALLLTFRRTRRTGLYATWLMHATLLLTLGPWGLHHEPGVLLWNLFFLLQNSILFREPPPQTTPTTPDLPSFVNDRLAQTVTALALWLPLLNPLDYWDNWPSWSVYSSHPGIVELSIQDEDVSRLPSSLQPLVDPPQPLTDWRRVRLDQWSFAVRRVPPYPQDRWKLAVARAVIDRAQLTSRARLSISIRPSWWSPTRIAQLVPTSSRDMPQGRMNANTAPRDSEVIQEADEAATFSDRLYEFDG
ncbi:MAG: hypothetical protein ACK5Q5_20460 [Planctomycetaceae bacterium]